VSKQSFKNWYKSGEPGIWISGGAVAISVIMTIGLIAVIAVRGLGHFWPSDVIEARYSVPGQPVQMLLGELVQEEEVTRERLAGAGLPIPADAPEFMRRDLFKVGNRDLTGADFTWLVGDWLSEHQTPEDVVVLERREWGNFYGRLVNVQEAGKVIAEGDAAWAELQQRIARVDGLQAKLNKLHKGDIGAINHGLERLRLQERRLELDGQLTDHAKADLAAERAELNARYKGLEAELMAL